MLAHLSTQGACAGADSRPPFANRAPGGSDAGLETTLRNTRLNKYLISTCYLSTLCQILFGKFCSQPAGPHRCSVLNLTGHPVKPTPNVPQKGLMLGQTCPGLPMSEVTAARPHHPAFEPSQHDVYPRTRGPSGAAWTLMVAASPPKRKLCFLSPRVAP